MCRTRIHYALLALLVNNYDNRQSLVNKKLTSKPYAQAMQHDVYIEQAQKLLVELQEVIEAYLDLEYQLYLQAHFDLQIEFPHDQEEKSQW